MALLSDTPCTYLPATLPDAHIPAHPSTPCPPDCSQAFKSYDEAGVPRRVQCLKYLVLASMLMESKVRKA